MRARACLATQLALFAALTAADLFLTWRLLTQGLSSVYESNPLAAWCLGRFGWPGLALFKFSTALLTGGSAVAISARRPRAGCGVLLFGSAVLSGVVLYSSVLLGVAREWRDDVRACEAARAAERRVAQALDTAAAYRALQAELVRGLDAGALDLPEAVERLLAADLARDPRWLECLRRLYGLESDRDCVATQFMLYAIYTARADARLYARATGEWLAGYRARFRAPAAPPWERAGLFRPPRSRDGAP